MVHHYLRKIVTKADEYLEFGHIQPAKQRGLYSDFLEVTLNSPEYNPVFFLSTGRTGTKLFSSLLEEDHSLKVYHAPRPELILEGRFLYENHRDAGRDMTPQAERAFFLLGRGDILFETEQHAKQYVETNNRVTFFLHCIKQVIPHARFVHLYRHPGEFIRSGVRRNWYSGSHEHDLGRIEPVSGIHRTRWPQYSVEEKIAWLWDETNRYILEQLHSLPSDRYFSLNFNEMNVDNLEDMIRFIGADIGREHIIKAINKPVNVQQSGSYPHYWEWSDELKEKLENICGPLMSELGYTWSE